MSVLNKMIFYQRKLPHWQPVEAEYFITFRLAGSLPSVAVERLRNFKKQQKDGAKVDDCNRYLREVFLKYEDFLDGAGTGPTWLRSKKIAKIVQEALHFHDKENYDLYAYTIMSNHVHVVFKHLDAVRNNPGGDAYNFPVTKILHSIKSYTAFECNKMLGRTGKFWQAESFDRVIRNQDELEKTIQYTLNNPVKAGLVDYWKNWPFNYCKPEFTESLM